MPEFMSTIWDVYITLILPMALFGFILCIAWLANSYMEEVQEEEDERILQDAEQQKQHEQKLKAAKDYLATPALTVYHANNSVDNKAE